MIILKTYNVYTKNKLELNWLNTYIQIYEKNI